MAIKDHRFPGIFTIEGLHSKYGQIFICAYDLEEFKSKLTYELEKRGEYLQKIRELCVHVSADDGTRVYDIVKH